MPQIDRDSIQNQQLIEKGLHVFGPSETANEEVRVITMPITTGSYRGQESGGNPSQKTYTAENDITEELPDGRLILVLRKGASIPMEEAIRKGIVKPPEEKKVGPSERKPGAGPKETK